MAVQIQLRRDTAADWTAADPTLAEGEAGYETDTGKLKIGDGATAWSSLAYFGGGLADMGAFTYLDGTVGAAPGTPGAGKLRVYAKTGPVLAVKDDAGTETVLGQGIADMGAFSFLDATDGAAPADPAAGHARIYSKAGRIYSRDSSGTEYGPFDAAGGGAGSDAYSDHIKTHSGTDLVAYWRLDEAAGSTSFADYMGGTALTIPAGSVNAGGPTLVGDSTGQSVGIPGGGNGRLSRTAVTLALPLTLELWIVLGQAGSCGSVGQWNGSGVMLYAVGLGDVRGYAAGSYRSAATTQANHYGRHHAVITVDGSGTSTFYWDGSQVGATWAGGNALPAATVFEAGAYNNGGGSSGPVALVSDIALYSTALSSSEVAAHYTNGNQ